MQIPEGVIIRSIQKNATEEELVALSKWLTESKRHTAFYFQLEEIWSARKILSRDSIQESWDMLAKQIEKQPQQPIISKKNYRLTWWRYVAAVFIGVLIASTIWVALLQKETLHRTIVENVVYNSSGTQFIVLPDQSEVWLHEKSCLTYPDLFSGKKRFAALEGKAYFEVANNNDKPFILQAGDVIIEVTGTEFYVETFSEEESSVTLISGSVNLNYADNGKRVSVPLIPGQRAYINSVNATVDIEKVNTNYYLAWKDGTYRFTEERLERIGAMLMHHYDVDIHIASSFKNKCFTGRVGPNDKIEDVLRVIESSYPINYNITNGVISITESSESVIFNLK